MGQAEESRGMFVCLFVLVVQRGGGRRERERESEHITPLSTLDSYQRALVL